MTGHRFHIASHELRRKLSRQTLKSRFSRFSDFWRSHWKKEYLQNDPWWPQLPRKWSFVAYGASPPKKVWEMKVETWKCRNSKRCTGHRRDWSGWNPLNLNGVPFGDEKDSLRFMDYPWLHMDCPWMVIMDNPWIIHGLPMVDYPWIIHP